MQVDIAGLEGIPELNIKPLLHGDNTADRKALA